ncbi:PQQ-dependent sugar dehydrogenase [Lysinibacillus sp. NPDC093210]|uniref:PQQ-dependent sugar dehydrogenase n=1 Tax=Lysinibacillus sp. NPDC093210 TaxID=3364133 RepID=UPI0038055378
MKKKIYFLFFIIILMTGCSTNTQQQPTKHRQENVTDNLAQSDNLEIVADNLDIPWAIEKYKNMFYVTERAGHIVKIKEGEVERQRVNLKKELATAAEAGLLGFVLAPDFVDSKLAYAYYTYVDGDKQFNRIVTLRQKGDVWHEEHLLLDRIVSGTFHHGGRLKIGPDGNLYATVGDALQSSVAQDPSALEGKILRIHLDGTVPSDNPFPNSFVYSYGHRNPQGLTWSLDGTLFASEHGNSANDEINKIEAGQNYGWPIIEGYETRQLMKAPLFTSGSSTTWAPSGIGYYDNKLYVATLRGAAVLEFDLETSNEREIISGLGRIRDILVDEQYLYFVSNNTDGRGNPLNNDDKLYRIPL